jgi:hypothetical protein
MEERSKLVHLKQWALQVTVDVSRFRLPSSKAQQAPSILSEMVQIIWGCGAKTMKSGGPSKRIGPHPLFDEYPSLTPAKEAFQRV